MHGCNTTFNASSCNALVHTKKHSKPKKKIIKHPKYDKPFFKGKLIKHFTAKCL